MNETDTPTAAPKGVRKAAAACIALGSEAAAAVFSHLPLPLVEQLTLEMATVSSVDADQATEALEELSEFSRARSALAAGGPGYACAALEHAFGRERAEAILGRLASAIEERPFEFLRHVSPEQIHALLRSESVQTIAYVTASLPTPQLAAAVLAQLEPQRQVDVAIRIARLAQVAADVAKELAHTIELREPALGRRFCPADARGQVLADRRAFLTTGRRVPLFPDDRGGGWRENGAWKGADMSTLSHGSPPVVRERPSWSVLRAVPEMWASLATVAMWVAVFLTAIWRPDARFSSVDGSSSTIPTAVFTTFFAVLGTWIVARRGFRQHGDD